MTTIKVIVFDLGNVLFRFDPMKTSLRIAQISANRLSPAEVFRFFSTSLKEKEYCEGLISTQEWYQHVAKELRLKCSLEDFSVMFTDIFRDLPESFEIVKRLKKKGYPLLLLSNTNELHYEFLFKRNPVMQLFDRTVLSYKEHCQKPQEKIYRIVIGLAECRPEEILFIDDLAENIEGAAKVGIQGHHFRGPKKLLKDLEQRKIL